MSRKNAGDTGTAKGAGKSVAQQISEKRHRAQQESLFHRYSVAPPEGEDWTNIYDMFGKAGAYYEGLWAVVGRLDFLSGEGLGDDFPDVGSGFRARGEDMTGTYFYYFEVKDVSENNSVLIFGDESYVLDALFQRFSATRT